jgi:hypothetical protein
LTPHLKSSFRLSVRRCRTLGLAIVIVLAASLPGCAMVKPWERGALADSCMAASPDPEEAKLEQHFFAYREGSAGGSGGAGGGCGCN